MSDHFHTLRRDSESKGGAGSSAKTKPGLPTLARALPWLLLAAFFGPIRAMTWLTAGLMQPVQSFVAGYAAFVLADTALLFCDDKGDDHCATPWDACCEDPDKLQSGRASVQFVDAAGGPLAGSLKGHAGLAPSQRVVVAGKVAAASTPKNLIIEARGLYLGGPDR